MTISISLSSSFDPPSNERFAIIKYKSTTGRGGSGGEGFSSIISGWNGDAKFVSREIAMIRNFNYRFAISGAPFSEIERLVLPRAIKELGHSGYWGGMTLDREDFSRFFIDSSFDVAASKSQNVSTVHKNVMYPVVVREKFSWQTPETLTLRQFADSAPVHNEAPFHGCLVHDKDIRNGSTCTRI